MGNPSRRIRPMTAQDLRLWSEQDSGPVLSALDFAVAAETTEEWGCCGVIAGPPGLPIGGLLLRAAETSSTTAGGSQTALLTDIYVAAEERGHGLGRQLVQSAAAELSKRDVVACEAVGHPQLPVGFLLAVGFRIVRPHPVAPRLRLDLNTTVRWRPDLAAAWQRIAGLVPTTLPPRPAQPAGFEPTRLVQLTPRG